jgi:uncharacterized protein (TIGR00299 family) protein
MTLYFDCFAGAAGDMILGALIDAGLPLAELTAALGTLGVDGWHVTADPVTRCGIRATNFRVHESVERSPHGHYHLPAIEKKIDQSALSPAGRARAKHLFQRLAGAESTIHGAPIEKVHLHEVGALDSIIDIVGAVFALEWFNADRIVVSPINVGSGMIKTAHGLLPVPAPATLALLGEAPVYGSAVRSELLTPTGALVLTDYASAYGPLPPMRVDAIGYGAGDRDLEGTPNVLRVVVGTATADPAAMRVAVLECEIDDMNPQIFGALMERLQTSGALDVFYAPVQMKKNRPGTLVTVIARPEDRVALTDLLFRETTTIGVRHAEMARECLQRETQTIETPVGPVRFKVASRDGRVLNAQPEFEDLSRLAAERGLPIKTVQAVATKAWLDR